jgi:hypothetical protein
MTYPTPKKGGQKKAKKLASLRDPPSRMPLNGPRFGWRVDRADNSVLVVVKFCWKSVAHRKTEVHLSNAADSKAINDAWPIHGRFMAGHDDETAIASRSTTPSGRSYWSSWCTS